VSFDPVVSALRAAAANAVLEKSGDEGKAVRIANAAVAKRVAKSK